LGKLYVVSGPSGGGKNTIVRSILERRANVYFSVSATTRVPRAGEVDGVDYRFVSADEFERMRANGEFLECSQHLDNWYGTPVRPITDKLAAGYSVILDIETTGAGNVFRLMPEAVGIFVMPESDATLERQLRSRGTETEPQIYSRMRKNMQELSLLGMYKYKVTNIFGNPDAAVAEFENILNREELQ
jgi:guanylate kinase